MCISSPELSRGAFTPLKVWESETWHSRLHWVVVKTSFLRTLSTQVNASQLDSILIGQTLRPFSTPTTPPSHSMCSHTYGWGGALHEGYKYTANFGKPSLEPKYNVTSNSAMCAQQYQMCVWVTYYSTFWNNRMELTFIGMWNFLHVEHKRCCTLEECNE